MSDVIAPPVLKAKDFKTDQDVRWCPGCGDYSILSQVQSVLPTTGIKKEDIVMISGIGCSSRFPYYMNTYGMHSIHGRAPAFASGLKAARPELSVWMVTGDGDGLSIGGNHLIHVLRRNLDIQILLFNNEIYGLTKGQYSPTSRAGTVNKATPMGSIDHPFNPLALGMGADATFVARSMDRDPKHLKAMLIEANNHKGTSFLEIYQNCNIFNDGAFFTYTEKDSRKAECLYVEHGQPMIFGADDNKGIKLDGFTPTIVDLNNNGNSVEDLLVHDRHDINIGQILTRMFDDPSQEGHFPRPFGVFYQTNRPIYDTVVNQQIEQAKAAKPVDLDALIRGNETWTIS